MNGKNSVYRALEIRPLAVLGSAFLITAFLLSLFDSSFAAFAICAAAAVASIVSLFLLKKKKYTARILLAFTASVTAAVLLFSLYTARYSFERGKYEGGAYSFRGVVKEVEYSDSGNYRLDVRLTGHPFTELPKKVNAVLYMKGDEALPDFYDEITFNAAVLKPLVSSEFDLEAYNEQNKISASLYLRDSLVTVKEGRGFLKEVKSFRRKTAERITRLYGGENGGIISSLLLGEDKIPYDIEIYSRIAGVSHIFVLSGLHIGLLSGAVFYVCTVMLRQNRRRASVISGIIIWIFVFMTGFRISAVRAGIMFTMFLLAGLFGRQGDSLTSLIFAGIFITVINPLAAASPSFLLSFSATLGVCEFTKPVTDMLFPKIDKMPKAFAAPCRLIAASVSSNIAILPFSLYFFKGFSLIGILLNIIVIPLFEILTAASALSVIPLFGFLAPFCNLLCAVLTEIIKAAGKSRFGYFGMNYDLVRLVLPILLTAVILMVILKEKKEFRTLFLSSVIITAAVFSLSFISERNMTVQKEILSDKTVCNVVLTDGTAVTSFRAADEKQNPDTDEYIIANLSDYLISKNARRVIVLDEAELSRFEEFRTVRKLFDVIEINSGGIKKNGVRVS